MKIPGGDRAIVSEQKVYDYLLSPDHPIGRFKARVFNSVGYRRDLWQSLHADLVALADSIDAYPLPTDEFGQRSYPEDNP